MLIEKKIGSFKLMDAFAVALSKTITEQLLAPFIGNGNWKSGAIKVISGAVTGKFLNKLVGNKISNYLATGFVIDGTEDIINYVMQDKIGGQRQETGSII